MNLRVPSMGRLVMPLGKRDLDLLQKMKTRAFLEKVLYKSEKSDKIFIVDGTGRNTTGNPETKRLTA